MKKRVATKSTLKYILILVFTFSVSGVFAHNKVVVIPLNTASKLNNIVTVSNEGEDFTDPVAF
jgi:hypothetical protein